MNKNELQDGEIMPGSISFQPYFLICKSCFWCASCVYDPYRIINCPICNEDTTIESIPLSNHEAFRLDYDNRRGVTVEFFPMGKV